MAKDRAKIKLRARANMEMIEAKAGLAKRFFEEGREFDFIMVVKNPEDIVALPVTLQKVRDILYPEKSHLFSKTSSWNIQVHIPHPDELAALELLMRDENTDE